VYASYTSAAGVKRTSEGESKKFTTRGRQLSSHPSCLPVPVVLLGITHGLPSLPWTTYLQLFYFSLHSLTQLRPSEGGNDGERLVAPALRPPFSSYLVFSVYFFCLSVSLPRGISYLSLPRLNASLYGPCSPLLVPANTHDMNRPGLHTSSALRDFAGCAAHNIQINLLSFYFYM